MKIQQLGQVYSRNVVADKKNKQFSNEYNRINNLVENGVSNGLKSNRTVVLNQYFSLAKEIISNDNVNINEVKNSEKIDDNGIPEDIKIMTKKMEEMNKRLEELGVDARVTSMGMETVPQSYSTYFAEPNNENEDNTVLMEIDGKFFASKTNLSAVEFNEMLDKFRNDNGFNKEKFSDDKLKNLFKDFFGNITEIKSI